MDPANPMMSGVVQNQDSYMKGKIAQRVLTTGSPAPCRRRSTSLRRETGRRYGFVEPYRCEDAEYILVGMGCYMETAKATVDYLREKGFKVGCLNVTCFRPFPAQADRRGAQARARRSRSSSAWTIRSRPATTCHARSRPRSATRSPARTASETIDPRSRSSTARRPGWAAATCGRATSSPCSTNMIGRQAGLLLRRHQARAGR